MKRFGGFTLLEVVISIAILAFISVFVAQAIQKGLQARSKIQRDIDRSVALREAVNLISRDVQMAFNYRDVNIELYNAAIRQRCKPQTTPTPTPPAGQGGTQGGTPPPNPTPPINNDPNYCKEKTQKIVTQFIGEEDELNFTTLSHVRLRRDDPSSDQAEVGYFLRNCKSRVRGQDAGNCLWRRISPILDEKVQEGGRETVLIENVKSLNFRYLAGGGEEEWVKIWSTTGQSDTTKTNKFPAAVEITLQVLDLQFKPPKEIGMTVVAPLRFPNNPKEVPNAAPTGI